MPLPDRCKTCAGKDSGGCEQCEQWKNYTAKIQKPEIKGELVYLKRTK